MTALGAVALGLLLVLADVRFSGVDVLPDALGWVLAALGTSALARTDDRFTWVFRLAVLAAVLSLASLWHPVVTVTDPGGGDGVTTSTTGPVDPVGLQGAVVSAHHAVAVVFSVLLSLRVRDRAQEHDDPAVGRRFGLFAVLHAVLGALVLLGSVAAVLADPAATRTTSGLLLAVALAAVAVQVWFVVALSGIRLLPWLQPGATPAQPG